MVYQTDSRLLEEIRRDGCLFLSILYSREYIKGLLWSPEEVNEAWIRAKEKKILSSDNLLQNYPGILEEFHLPLSWPDQGSLGLDRNAQGWILPVPLSLNGRTFYTVERWRWKQDHFVVGDGSGTKPVLFDPIEGGSYTVRYGRVVDLRVFYRTI